MNQSELIELILAGKIAKTVFTDYVLREYEQKLENQKDSSGKAHAEYLLFKQRKKELGLE